MPREYIIVSSAPNEAGQKRIRFSAVEIRHILISMAVLTLGFAFFFSNMLVYGFLLDFFILNLIIAAVGVSTEFLLHELAHKFTAQKYGCWSEYRYTELGLVLTLMSGIAGFLIAAPGVVYHSGYITREQEGKISAAGPATNLALGGIFLGLWLFVPLNWFFTYLTFWVALINIWVGAFNLVPIPPLDGSKIWKWSIPIYIAMWAGFILMGIGLYRLHPIFL